MECLPGELPGRDCGTYALRPKHLGASARTAADKLPNQSAGKRRSGHTTKGDQWLRAALTQAAWASSHTKATYLSAQDHRLAKRRGKKRALIAVGHTLLTIAYYVRKRGTSYVELGAEFLDRIDPGRTTRSLVKRLEQLGYKVHLETRQDAA